MASDEALTPKALRGLIAHLLAGAAGGAEGGWRKLVQIERLNIVMSPATNWAIVPRGTAKQRDAITKAVAVVKDEHPYAAWPQTIA